jgi:Raf kinase inhibitor-like YbhB/YbcL family protein
MISNVLALSRRPVAIEQSSHVGGCPPKWLVGVDTGTPHWDDARSAAATTDMPLTGGGDTADIGSKARSPTANQRITMTLNDPFARLPRVPSFTLTSSTVSDGQSVPPAQYSGAMGIPGGEDVSPQLSWSGAPEGTKGYAVTMYDPDAPTGAGFWHWAVANIPATITELPEGAGDDSGSALPNGSYQLPGDSRASRFIGSAPPAGDGAHRYFITVHALDVADIGVPADGTPSYLGFSMLTHTLGRATIVMTGEIAA